MKRKVKALASACVVFCCALAAPAWADSLLPGQTLTMGQSLNSHDGRYAAVMQGDGNFVVYRRSDGVAIWNTGTVGTGATFAAMQTDGNFVIYTAAGKAVWWTGTSVSAGYANEFTVDDEGLAAVYAYAPTWSTGTGVPVFTAGQQLTFQYGFRFEPGVVYNGPNGNQWTFQTDGNLVMYRNGSPIWASNVTQAHGGKALYAVFEGGLVTWNDSGYVWQFSGQGYPAGFIHDATGPFNLGVDRSLFILQSDGNAVIYTAARKWGAHNYDPAAHNLPPASGPHCIGDPRNDCEPGPVIGFPGSPPL